MTSKLPEHLTNDYVLNWLHDQKWERQEWNNNAYEQVSMIILNDQSWQLAKIIHEVLQRGPIDYQGYKYKIGFGGASIQRTSDKIRKPTENKVSYTVRKVSEVLN